MAETTVDAVDLPPAPDEHGSGLSVPPIDVAFFSQQFADTDGGSQAEVAVGDLDFDFSDDLWTLSADDLDELLNCTGEGFDFQPAIDSDSVQFAPNFGSGSSDFPQFSGDGMISDDRSSDDFGGLDSASPGSESHQISAYLNVASPESNGSNREMTENCGGDAKVMNCSSTESGVSENYGSNVSEDYDNFATRSITSSPNLNNGSIGTGIVDQKLKLEEEFRIKVQSSLLKRKKDCDDVNKNVESRSIKFKKYSCNSHDENNNTNIGLSEEDEKKKVRLLRNRESAQLSRQRKKQYVEELEDKVKTMHSTIQDLNAKISYFMAENATLRQQMGGPTAIQAPPVPPPPPGKYAYPVMMHPWMPYAPSPYMMKPQGSQVPLVPIPRLKPQQTAQALKTGKKAENKSKKNVMAKTKKVAGVSFIGLLFFVLLFGGLAPMINMRYGGVRESLTGVESYVGGGFYDKHHARILMVNGTASGSRRYSSGENSGPCDQRSCHNGGKLRDDESGVRMGNGSEPLVASLYVPRNDKLVRIDGNLVIHSVLASEKAMSSRSEGCETGTGTDLAIPGGFIGDVPVTDVGRIGARHHRLTALGSAEVENRRHKATDGKLQQWFREGLAGPMLSSGMCTEVLQFEVSSSSPSGAIVPSTTPRNISKERSNSTDLSKGRRNRRILTNLPIPLPDSSHNTTKQHSERNSQEENLTGNSSSPMVVSILVDPREASDDDIDGAMGTKSISRIFVVVLIDSVKYVTYSCMLPFKGTAHHLASA